MIQDVIGYACNLLDRWRFPVCIISKLCYRYPAFDKWFWRGQ